MGCRPIFGDQGSAKPKASLWCRPLRPCRGEEPGVVLHPPGPQVRRPARPRFRPGARRSPRHAPPCFCFCPCRYALIQPASSCLPDLPFARLPAPQVPSAAAVRPAAAAAAVSTATATTTKPQHRHIRTHPLASPFARFAVRSRASPFARVAVRSLRRSLRLRLLHRSLLALLFACVAAGSRPVGWHCHWLVAVRSRRRSHASPVARLSLACVVHSLASPVARRSLARRCLLALPFTCVAVCSRRRTHRARTHTPKTPPAARSSRRCCLRRLVVPLGTRTPGRLLHSLRVCTPRFCTEVVKLFYPHMLLAFCTPAFWFC